jgi:Ca-activated chloride channel family protein
VVLRVGDESWRTGGEEALQKLREAVNHSSRSRTAHAALVRGLLARGRLDEAVTAARRFADLDPDSPVARTLLAEASGAVGAGPDAALALAAEVEAAPRVSRAQLRAARAYEALGDERRACAHWVAAASLEPSNDDTRYEALRCRARLSEAPASLSALRALGHLGPRLTSLATALAAGPSPAYEAKTGGPGFLEAEVLCTAGTCPTPVLVTPWGATYSPLSPSDSRSAARLVALRIGATGTYRALLAGGGPDAQGELTFRAGDSVKKFPISGAGVRTAAVAEVEWLSGGLGSLGTGIRGLVGIGGGLSGIPGDR